MSKSIANYILIKGGLSFSFSSFIIDKNNSNVCMDKTIGISVNKTYI